MLRHERECHRFRFDDAGFGAPHALEQPGRGVVPDVPVVHPRENRGIVVDGQFRPFGDDAQGTVGHERRNLQDDIDVRVKAGHLQIDPDELAVRIRVLHRRTHAAVLSTA